jgi:integrase/recombinase XerD
MFEHVPARVLAPVATVGAVRVQDENPERPATISHLLPYFLAYLMHELHRSNETVLKYQDCMGWILRSIGDIPPQKICPQHVMLIKARCAQRGAGPSRTASHIAALKAFLSFCRLAVGLDTLDPKHIRGPRIPKREILFLTADEVQEFVSAIPLRKGTRIFDLKGLCFRALVEVLLGTGMRISEALSLKRSSVNFETGEAKVIGKGNKERTVFFSPRALNWIKEYVTRRIDREDSLFLASGNKPLRRQTAVTWFGRLRRRAGIQKKVTAHVLRHTVATTLLFNGCPVGHIKEILGHEHLITTCKFYLGADKRAAKAAHEKYLTYEPPSV